MKIRPMPGLDQVAIEIQMANVHAPSAAPDVGPWWTWCIEIHPGKGEPCSGDDLCMCVGCLSPIRELWIEASR